MKKDEIIYVGIDFSKEKFNACLLAACAGVMGECEFPNTKSGYLSLIRWTKKASELGKAFGPSNVLYCGEHTGMYSIGLSDYLYGKGFKVWLENALMIKYGSGFQRGKSDKADAETIAYYARNFYRPESTTLYKPAETDLRVLRSMYQFRRRIVAEKVALGNIIQSRSLDACAMALRNIKRKYAQTAEDEKSIRKEMEKLMKESPALSRNYAILTSFSGIGPVSAAMLLIYTGNFTRFNDPRKFACYCGVAPFSKESGTSVHSKPRVSHFAQHEVKTVLTEVVKVAIRHNPVIQTYAKRLHAKGKHDGVVYNNAKDKIIHIIFKMISTQTPWNPNYHQEKTTGNPSQRHLGESCNEGATAAAPSADTTVQPSPSALGGDAKILKTTKMVKISTTFSQKTCILT